MRLIDAVELVRDIDIAFKGIKASDEEFERFRDLCGLIWMQPIVDHVKHGRWDLIDSCEPMRYGCSVCHRMVWRYENYCPNCGAKMDEVSE